MWAKFLVGLYRGVPADSLIEIRVTHEGNCKKGVFDRRYLPIYDGSAWKCLEKLLETNKKLPSMVAFGVNPRNQMGGSDADVGCCVAVVVDVDGNKIALEKQKERAGEVTKLVKPYAWVSSGSNGHGHLYWRLREPVVDKDRYRATVKRLRKYLETDPSEPPMKIMRLPGSLNWKNGFGQAVNVWTGTSSITLEEIDKALDSLGVNGEAARLNEPRQPSDTKPTAGGAVLEGIEVSPARVQQLWSLLSPAVQQKVYDVLPDTNGLGLRHRRDAAVARALLMAGASDEEVEWFFAAVPDGLGSKYFQQGNGYLHRTIMYARSTVPDASHVDVREVWPGPPYGRVKLRLSVATGRYAGIELTHGVESRSSCWPWLFRAAGFEPVPHGDTEKAVWLKDRQMRVELGLREWGGKTDLQVKRFFPAMV